MKKLKFVNRVIWWINSLTAVALLCSNLSPYIDPNIFWPTAFLGLGYPFLLLINVLFVLYWSVKFKRQFLLSLIVIAIGYNHIFSTLQIGNNAEEKTETSIKVMSYNVRLFDLYNWSKNKQTRNKMFQLIKDEDPDIACFQEFFYTDNRDYFETKDTLKRVLNAKNYHVETVKYVKNGKQHFAIATYSKYKIINKGKVSFKDSTNNICIFSDILFNNDTVRVYNAHLASVHFAPQDYNFLDSVTVNSGEKQIKGIKNISKRLRRAYKLRSSQAANIAEHMQNCNYPIIFCTDMNDTPVSYSYKQISNELNDSFKEKGSGLGTSYNGKFSTVRIDFIFHNDYFECLDFKTLPDEYSDHFPITAILNKK